MLTSIYRHGTIPAKDRQTHGQSNFTERGRIGLPYQGIDWQTANRYVLWSGWFFHERTNTEMVSRFARKNETRNKRGWWRNLVGVKNVYIGMSLTELQAEKRQTELELKKLGQKYTLMEFGNERDDVGSQIYAMYFTLSEIEKAIKATAYAV
jgi:hypothetical protein